jgi:hypothetical protein
LSEFLPDEEGQRAPKQCKAKITMVVAAAAAVAMAALTVNRNER